MNLNAFSSRVMLLLVCLCMPLAHAADDKGAKSQEQIRRLRQQMQQLQQTQQQTEQKFTQEKAALDEQLKKSGSELGGVRRKFAEAQKAASETASKLASAEKERDELRAKFEEASKKLIALEETQRSTAEKLRVRDAEALGLQKSLTAELTEHSRCEANNLALYQYGRELMTLYRNKGVSSVLSDREPVLGFGKVKMENLLEEYRDKLDAQKRLPAVLEGPTTAAGVAAP